jgi:tetratricopeptide (TPR) repeat protein
LETAGALSQVPEGDLAEESVLWMGRAYHSLGDVPAAVQAFAHLIVVASSDIRRQEAQDRLSRLLNQHIRSFYDRKAWVTLLKFHADHQQAFHLVPLERERVLMVAQSFQQVNLPSEALHWYDQLLQEYPDGPLREDILVQKVLLAEEQGNGSLVREVGASYLREFPGGQWRGQVETARGMEALASQRYAEAIQDLSEAIQHVDGIAEQRHVLRNRARAYRALGQMELAIQDLRQVVSIQPAQIADVIRLGDALFDQGEYAEAALLYDQVLGSDAPVALKAWAKYRLAVSLEHMGQYLKAQKLLAEIRQLETGSPELEHTIRSAATAVLDEISLKEKPRVRIANEQTKS